MYGGRASGDVDRTKSTKPGSQPEQWQDPADE